MKRFLGMFYCDSLVSSSVMELSVWPNLAGQVLARLLRVSPCAAEI